MDKDTLLFDHRYNIVVAKIEDLRNGQVLVKQYNGTKTYEAWKFYLWSLEDAIQKLELQKQNISKIIEELKCLT
jgi:hypothetical protein